MNRSRCRVYGAVGNGKNDSSVAVVRVCVCVCVIVGHLFSRQPVEMPSSNYEASIKLVSASATSAETSKPVWVAESAYLPHGLLFYKEITRYFCDRPMRTVNENMSFFVRGTAVSAGVA